MRLLTKILLIFTMLATLNTPVRAAESIKIGEISEAKLWNLMAVNQRRGFQLALEEINEKGGVLGRPLELVSRDGGDGSPAEVLRDVEELVDRQGIRLLTGTCPDNIGLAVSNYAKKRGIFYLKPCNGTDRHIWQEGHDLAFRFDVSNYMYGKVFADLASKMPAKRWAIVAPDYEFGHAVVDNFKTSLKQLRPDVEFVATQWHPLQKIDAGAVSVALKQAKPDAIFLAHWGAPAVQLIREGKKRALFEGRPVVSVLLGQPEGLDALGKEAPVGWITQGYPYDQIDAPAHKAFLAAYRAKYKADPGWFSFIGYECMMSLAKAIEKAGSDDPHQVAAAMKGLTFDSTVGPLTYRAADNQSSLGLWVGKIALKGDKPYLADWTYEPGDKFYPGDAYVNSVRPASQNQN